MTDHLLQILLYVTSAIGTIVTAASAAAKFIDPLSPLGQWVAWVASCPIGHSPRVVKTVRLPSKAERKAAGITEAMKNMGPSLVLIASLSALTLLNGCAGTLEESRAQLRLDHLVGLKVASRDDATCRALSSKERIWTGITVAGTALSGASGIATIPVDSKRGDQLLAAGTVVAATGAVVGLALQQSYAREWQSEGCGQ